MKKAYIFIFAVLFISACLNKDKQVIPVKLDDLDDVSNENKDKNNINDEFDLSNETSNLHDKDLNALSKNWKYFEKNFVVGSSGGKTMSIELAGKIDQPLSSSDKEILNEVLSQTKIASIIISEIPHKDFLEFTASKNFNNKIIYKLNFTTILDREDNIKQRVANLANSPAVKNIDLYLSTTEKKDYSKDFKRQVEQKNNKVLEVIKTLLYVEKIQFTGDFNDDVIKYLKPLKNLKTLFLYNSSINISDSSLNLPSVKILKTEFISEITEASKITKIFPNLNRLETSTQDLLTLGDTKGLNISELQFHKIKIDGNDIDPILKSIAKLANIKKIDFGGIYVSSENKFWHYDRFIGAIVENLKNLDKLATIKVEPYLFADEPWLDFYSKLGRALAPIKVESEGKDKKGF